MELHLTPEQEAALSSLANHTGKPVEQLISDVAMSMLRENRLFLDAVERGTAAADRGEFVEEDEVDARIERMLRS